MWIVARYMPVAPFSLKPAAATSSGGKTLLAPTPYAIKMALLDVAIRTTGVAEGERLFPSLRDLSISLALPQDLVVIKGFSKIQRPLKDKGDEQKALEAQERGHWPMQPTIAYREYVYYRDAFQLAFTSSSEGTSLPSELHQLLTCINYFGKRGGFVQIMGPPQHMEQLPDDQFIELTPDSLRPFHTDGTLQVLDDCGNSLTFQRANIYSTERITTGKERVLRHVVLPYRLKRSSRSYSWYQRISEEQ
jgi:hypothetical protein